MPAKRWMMHLARREALRARDRNGLHAPGEKHQDRAEAQQVAETLSGEVLERIRARGSASGHSVKLTQLGLDLSPDLFSAI